jgi:GNAT superfamily N-acetyltransferase
MTEPQNLRIRPATPSDGETFLALIQALADYEHLDGPDADARRRLLTDAFGPHPRFSVLLAEFDGRAVGYAVMFETYSTFLARPTLYLEDLFILPEFRRIGAGSALFKAVAAEARTRGCGRLEWQVLDWNRLAIDFYERFGAQRLRDWLPYRLTADDLHRFGSDGG